MGHYFLKKMVKIRFCKENMHYEKKIENKVFGCHKLKNEML